MAIKNKNNSQSDMSCTSAKEEHNNNDELQQHLCDFINAMLKGRVFIGDFKEKRYVANLNEYRDVIVVDDDETELQVDLSLIKRRLVNTFKDKWIGITTSETIGAPVGLCIWGDLHEEVFGRYWYKIKCVNFRDKEVLLNIKPLKGLVSNTKNTDKSVAQKKETVKKIPFDFYKSISCENIKETVKFLFVLTGTLLVASIEGVKYFSEFSLKLIRELSNLIKALTPFSIACLGMIEKIFGGFLILISMIFRDLRKPQHNFVMPPRPMLTYNNHDNIRQIKYRKRYGGPVKIVEM